MITKLDGHAKGGGALSAVAATERYFVSNPRSGTIINLVFQPCYFHWNWRTYRQPGAIREEAVHQQAVGNGGHWGLDGTGEGLEHGRGQDDGRHQEGPVHPEEHVWTVPEHHEAWTHITGDHTYIQLQRWIFLSQVMGMIPGLSSVFGGGQGGNGQVTFFWTFSSLISWFQGERPGEYEKTKASDDHHGQHERQGKSTTHNILIIIWTWLGTWRHGCFQDLHQTANKSLQNCLWSWCHGDGGYHF